MNAVIHECDSCHLLFTLESDKEEHKKLTGHSSYREHRLGSNNTVGGHISETVRILESAIGGISRTKLMYSTYVSYSKLEQYANLLILSGLLEYDNLDAVYRTTDKGINFLNTYKQIQRLHMNNFHDV